LFSRQIATLIYQSKVACPLDPDQHIQATMSAAEASSAPATETKKVKLTSADNEEFAVEHEVVCLGSLTLTWGLAGSPVRKPARNSRVSMM